MQIIPALDRALCKCAKCGETRSVKYLVDDKPMCNLCALKSIGNKQDEMCEDLHMEQLEQM
jgi:formylmethanofuran dehydrogenase subunit E